MILYDKPIDQRPKKRIDKEEFASLQESVRLMHNYVQVGHQSNTNIQSQVALSND